MADPRIRRVQESDLPDLIELIHELAVFEKLLDEWAVTPDRLRTVLFGPAPSLFGHVAEVDGKLVGYALWFLSFSTFRGTSGIYLEDVYVQPTQRGSGLGKAMLVALAELCVERGYGRFEWSVLKWNTSAIDVYRSLGAVELDEWTGFRLTDDALKALGS